MNIITTDQIKVDPGNTGTYTVDIKDLQTTNKYSFSIFADGKKQAVSKALLKIFPGESWIMELCQESTTWFDYVNRLLDVNINAEVNNMKMNVLVATIPENQSKGSIENLYKQGMVHHNWNSLKKEAGRDDNIYCDCGQVLSEKNITNNKK